MKKVILATTALAASAFALDLWTGSSGEERVITGLDNGTKTSGYWYDYNDIKEGGTSAVTYPVPKGNEYSAGSLQPVIAECGGVCGVATIAHGTNKFEGFVGIGFNVAGEKAGSSDKDPAVATEWGGVCVTYLSEAPIMLELGQGDAGDAALAYGPPFANLPKATTPTVKKLAWSDFEMPEWAKADARNTTAPNTGITGETASKTLVALKFKFQGADGNYKFNITAVGKYSDNCPEEGDLSKTGEGGGSGSGSSAIGNVAVSSAKAILSGRTLSFSGISSANVEILNLQGQIVMKGSAASSMNLMGLDAGVYMVRVAGKSVNMNQKILLK